METKISKRMFELSEEIRGLTAEARVLGNNGELAKAKEKIARMHELREAYETEKALFEMEQLLGGSEPKDKKLVGADGEKPTQLDLWTKALRKKFRNDDANDAYKATILTEGTAATAGYLVPQDISTAIREYKTNRFSFEPYIRTEKVKTKTGSRVYRKRGTTAAFQQVDEGGAIPLIGVPEYEQVTFSVKDYGGILQVTNDLFSDTSENLRGEIVKHMAWCREDTINSKVLSILTGKTETALDGDIASIRTALITLLGGAYTPTSKIYTNDDGYAYLCNLQDENDRDYFFYDPRTGGAPAISLGGIIVPVVQVPDAVMPSTPAANSKTEMPFIIGDLEEAVTNFDRQQFSIAASNEATISYVTGAGTEEEETVTVSAFQNNLTFFRAFMRNDFKSVDSSAWLNCTITA